MADENALEERPTPSQPTDRTELIDKARIFLNSPQVRYEDPSAKRRFLAEKGLNDTEIDGLLQELVRQILDSHTTQTKCKIAGEPVAIGSTAELPSTTSVQPPRPSHRYHKDI